MSAIAATCGLDRRDAASAAAEATDLSAENTATEDRMCFGCSADFDLA